MLIALQLVGTPHGPVDDEPVRSFEDDQIVIGRAPNCHVVLPDGLRIISRQHARLTTQRGEVQITCLSASAPVRVNDVGVPHGGMLTLRGGDVVHIGGFDLLMSAPRPAEPAVPRGDLSSPAKPDLLKSTPVRAPAPPVSAPVHEAVPASAPGAASTAVAPASIAAVSPPVEPGPVRRGRARLDEWFDLDPAMVAQAAPPTAAALTVSAEVDLDLRSGAYPPAPAPKGPELRVFESLQKVLSPQAEGAPVPTPPAHFAPPSSDPAVPWVPAMPPPHAPPAVPDADLVLLEVSAPAQHAPAEASPLDEPTSAELMLAFMEGAGLAPRTGATSTQMLAPMELTPAWMRHIGELLRASVEGSLALLHSRSTVKREMRAEVTVIARRQNNPLKFAPDALAALAHLVAAKRSPGFLEPVAALKDAHEDLLVHHLAVVAGMRAAMFELIARLGPDDVVREAGTPKGLGMTLPTLHEAALWRRYRQRHAEMTARLDDDFETVFGREFTKAYEAQARRVREQAPPEGTGS